MPGVGCGHRETYELVAHMRVRLRNRAALRKGSLRIDRQHRVFGHPKRFKAETLHLFSHRSRPHGGFIKKEQDPDFHTAIPAERADVRPKFKTENSGLSDKCQ